MLHRPRRHDDDGFTLVEVLVALMLFGLLAGTVSVALGALLRQTKTNQDRTVAANVGQRVIDRIHALDYDSIPLGVRPAENFLVGGQAFGVVTESTLVPDNGEMSASACNGTGALSKLRVSVTVTWTGMGSTRPVRTDTLRAQPGGTIDPKKGVATVKIVDRDGAPQSGQPVSLSPGTTTYVTGADGCAVFDDLTPGTYTASLATAGYVDQLGNATPTRSITVTAGAVTRDPGFAYDRAATLTGNWSLALPSTLTSFPPLTGTGATLGNSAFTANQRSYPVCGTAPCAQASSGSIQITKLFPFSTGYQPWAGACTDAKPGNLPAAVVLDPGESQSTNLPLQAVTVVMLAKSNSGQGNGNTTSLLGGSVQITHAVDAACATVNSTLTAAPTSNTVQLSLPGGRFSFRTGSGNVVDQQITPGGPMVTVTVTSS